MERSEALLLRLIEVDEIEAEKRRGGEPSPPVFHLSDPPAPAAYFIQAVHVVRLALLAVRAIVQRLLVRQLLFAAGANFSGYNITLTPEPPGDVEKSMLNFLNSYLTR